jgi:hypothetical protein
VKFSAGPKDGKRRLWRRLEITSDGNPTASPAAVPNKHPILLRPMFVRRQAHGYSTTLSLIFSIADDSEVDGDKPVYRS